MATSPDHDPQDLAVLSQLVEVLDQLGIQYAIGEALDYDYLRDQGRELGLTPLLDRVIQESREE